MPRKADVRVEQAHEMYQRGAKLVEIANQLGLPEGTIRSWKNRQKWDCNVANGKKCNVAKRKRGGQPGNHNAEGAGAPLKNHNAEKHGLFGNIFRRRPFLLSQKCRSIHWMCCGIRYRLRMQRSSGHSRSCMCGTRRTRRGNGK